MAPTPEGSSTLLLDRPVESVGPRPGDGGRPVAPAPSPDHHVLSQAVPDSADSFRAPVLAVLAAGALLEGYRWLGIIPSGDSRISWLLFGRIGTVVFALLALVIAVTATRPVVSAHRSLTHRMVVLASMALVTTAALLAASGTTTARYALGVSGLAVTAAVAAALFVGERQRRHAEMRTPSLPGDDAVDPGLRVT